MGIHPLLLAKKPSLSFQFAVYNVVASAPKYTTN